MSAAALLDITDYVQGDDRDYDFTVVDIHGVAEDITGWAFWFTVKLDLADADAAALFQLTTAAGGIVIDVAAAGLGRVCIRATHTKTAVPTVYLAELQCRKGSSGAKIETLATGTFTITPEITLAE